MAAFTHTMSNTQDPPLIQGGAASGNPTATVSGGSTTPGATTTLSLKLDDGTNQYTLTGTRSRILEVLQECWKLIASQTSVPLP